MRSRTPLVTTVGMLAVQLASAIRRPALHRYS